MKLLSFHSFLLVFASLCFVFPQVSGAQQRNFLLEKKAFFGVNSNQPLFINLENSSDFHLRSGVIKTLTDGGIKEDIPKKYREKYQKWKTQLLSTDFGRQQWESYAN